MFCNRTIITRYVISSSYCRRTWITLFSYIRLTFFSCTIFYIFLRWRDFSYFFFIFSCNFNNSLCSLFCNNWLSNCWCNNTCLRIYCICCSYRRYTVNTFIFNIWLSLITSCVFFITNRWWYWTCLYSIFCTILLKYFFSSFLSNISSSRIYSINSGCFNYIITFFTINNFIFCCHFNDSFSRWSYNWFVYGWNNFSSFRIDFISCSCNFSSSFTFSSNVFATFFTGIIFFISNWWS